jgi:hypothetical protein
MQKKSLVFSFSIISFFIALFAFSSCSKKEKDPSPNATKPTLIGVWDIEKMHNILYQDGNEVL